MTKTYKFKKNLMFLLSLLCSFGPLIVFTIMGLVQGEGREKICLTMTAIASIIMGLVCVLRKIHLRSTLYILMIGLWIALDNLLPFIITLMLCTMLDEIIFTPLHRRFREDYHTNKQFDKRMELKDGTTNI